MFVLAVNVHKQLPQLAQSLSRLGYAVDIVAGPATACHDAAQMAFLAVVEIAFGQPGASGRQLIKLEHRADVGPFRALADGIATGPVA